MKDESPLCALARCPRSDMHILGAHLPQDTLLPRSRVCSVGSAMSQDTVLLLHVMYYSCSCECTLRVDIPVTSTNLRNSPSLLPDEHYRTVHYESPISVGLTL